MVLLRLFSNIIYRFYSTPYLLDVFVFVVVEFELLNHFSTNMHPLLTQTFALYLSRS